MSKRRDNAVGLGIDRVLAGEVSLPGASSIGMLTHSPAVVGGRPDLPSYAALHEAGVPVVRLFSPEHGLAGVAADGQKVADGVDGLTGLPVVSLYGEVLEPTEASLAGLDLMVVDLQDVGSRFYTYAWALWHLLIAAGRAGLPCVLLDRPNPIGGVPGRCEGPLMTPECTTYLGRYGVPVRHGLTLGEMARLWVAEGAVDVGLGVIPMSGWERSMLWSETGLPWVAPSPALRRAASALLYPGLCFFEATNVGVGRGTERSFECVSAAWLDAGAAADAVMATWGVTVQAEAVAEGVVVLTVVDEAAFEPVCFGLWLLCEIRRGHDAFAWATYPTNAHPSGEDHLVRLLGRADALELILNACALIGSERQVFLRESTRLAGWADRVTPVLLYT
ncbi:exo-beta-N-acetylmuramidase NamZ family protein [Mucisphaera calidilacus]|uniref:DUF1343 domain-containing protein n=1 Tax=Mucisphaera calidilacus TaxID=2527982 RepID=A0A518BVX3_9BACT|nr:DUF1343 domain-containing protein [Mucisphaera calidilacus]QDU71125.1 hypothetical protein Pan265_09740 [Mucisphaera calidilacus]